MSATLAQHPAVFRSLTVWQAADYVVTVTFGRFASRDEAEAFGNQPLKLVLVDGDLQLQDGGTSRTLTDEDVAVSRLRASSADKPITDHTDYDPVAIRVAEFAGVPSLQSFGSLAYGAVVVCEGCRIVRTSFPSTRGEP